MSLVLILKNLYSHNALEYYSYTISKFFRLMEFFITLHVITHPNGMGLLKGLLHHTSCIHTP